MVGIKLHVWGDWACFTRPEMKVERVSYDIITPAAARGILEAIHWKPAIRWEIDRLHVLKPIKFQTFRRNEVGSKIPAQKARTAMARGNLDGLALAVDEDRQQRATIALTDVAYVIEAHFEMTKNAGGDDNPAKHIEMFKRRAVGGQCFHRPCLGCREFAADFELVEGDIPPSTLPNADRNRDLGWMHYDIDFKNANAPMFFRARLENGVLDVAKARREGLVR
ncbi:MAG: type I-C CRISPR-associated protein Cas5c [Pseudomonadota bacterium]